MAEYTSYSGYLDLSRKLTTEEKSILDNYLDRTFTKRDLPPTIQTRWCSWRVSDDGENLYCEENSDGMYDQPWLEHLIETFFKPWGVVLNGELEIESSLSDGEPAFFQVKDNVVAIVEASMVETSDLTELRKTVEYFKVNHPELYQEALKVTGTEAKEVQLVRDVEVELKEGEGVCITANNLQINIRYNDVGVSVDYRDAEQNDAEPFREDQVWWDDVPITE